MIHHKAFIWWRGNGQSFLDYFRKLRSARRRTKVETKRGGWDDLPLLESGITIHPNYGLTLGSTVHCTAGIGPSIAGIWALFMEFREQVVPAFSEFLHLPMHSVELVGELVPFSAPFLPEFPPAPTPLRSCNSVGANDTVS